MVIKKQPIISWLLEENYIPQKHCEITMPNISNQLHIQYLGNGIRSIVKIRETRPNWGLPELLMTSFEKVMERSVRSFCSIYHQLFQEFSNENVCGILIHKIFGTVVYGFGDGKLFVWLFRDIDGYSVLYNYFHFSCTSDNVIHSHCMPSILYDTQLYNLQKWDRRDFCNSVACTLITYLAVKKYAQVETIIVPSNSIIVVEDEIKGYKNKEKVKNDSGQEVIIMDSRWFVKIINDNDIFVRGFFRMQRHKNDNGEWDKKLIFVDSFIRHGYHRNAKIENATTDDI